MDEQRKKKVKRKRGTPLTREAQWLLGEVRHAMLGDAQPAATIIGLTVQTVQKIERGGNVDLSTLHTYLAALGGAVTVLFEFRGGVGEPPRSQPDELGAKHQRRSAYAGRTFAGFA